MLGSLIYIVLFFCLLVSAGRDEFCPVNEELSNCSQLLCRAQYCAQKEDRGPCAPLVADDCNTECVCIEGTLRNNDGICVPEDQCEDLCPPGEEFTVCIQTLCRAQDCSQVGKKLACPRIELSDCTSGCVCPEDFVRDENGACIPEEQCQVCDENEELDTCPGSSDEFCPISEDNTDCSITDTNPDKCGPPDCRCRFNFKRDNTNGSCIPTRNCPPFDCSARPNEEYNSCPPICSDSCSQATPSGGCLIIGRIGIILECQPTCRCIEGFSRNNGICVPFADCGSICNENEILNQCPNGCDNDACPINLNNQDENDCVALDACLPQQCQCIPNFKRDNNGNCIPIENCPQICPVNEEYSQCPISVCRTQSCNEFVSRPCPFIPRGFKCNDGCVCIEGTLRDDNGNCVPEDQCPGACSENEILNQCPSICNTDACPTNMNDEEDGKLCITLCGPPKCECKENFKRDFDGNCIPVQNCPRTCPANEEFSSCMQDICRAQYCAQIILVDQQIICIGIVDGACQKGCVCIPGTLRDENGICVPQDQCLSQNCGKNEQFNQCPSVCKSDACPTNLNDDAEEENIQACTKNCGSPKCECIENYRRDYNGNCIPVGSCPQNCPFNEEFCSCPQNLCRAQYCTQLDQPISCFDIENEFCQGGCVCIPGTLRDRNGNCVPVNECPNQNCPFNEEFYSCPQNLCRAQYCTQLDQPITCFDIEDTFCQGGCVCVGGTLRDESGNCVPEGQCQSQQQQCFAPNEELFCAQICPPEKTCRTRGVEFDCLATNERCNLKCVCKPGFFRNSIGDCISDNECDQCPGDNEFFSCGSACDNVCADLATQSRTNCPIVNIVCNRKCYCEDGFARDNNQNCVPVDQCPYTERKCADPNEEFFDCKRTCPPDSCFSLVARFKCESNPKCEPGCNCKPGFLRVNDTSSCVPICSCPEMENSPDCLD